MKTRIFFVLAVIGLLASCAKEQAIQNENVLPDGQGTPAGVTTLTVGLTEPEALAPQNTKTHMDIVVMEGKHKVYWSNGDQIAVNGVSSEPLSEIPEYSQTADFNFDAVLSTPYSIVYPASIYADATHVALPAIQDYRAGGFAEGMYPMAGCSADGQGITLGYPCAMVKISVLRAAADADEDNLIAVRFKGRNDEQVCGSFAIDYETATLTATSSAAADKEVRVIKTMETSTASACVYYVVVPAGTYSNGFDIIVQDVNGHIMTQSKTESTTLVAGHLYAMPQFEFVPTATELGVEIASAQDLIQFATDYNNKVYDYLGDALVVSLTTDITFDAESSAAYEATTGIGNVISTDVTNYFHGVFNGRNHTISGYTGSVPLFAYSGSSGIIENIILAADCDKVITADNANDLFGAFVGYHKGLLQNCVSHADLTFSNIANKGHFYGGLVGRNHGGRIVNCTMNGDVVCPAALTLSTAANQAGIGGIAGRSNGNSLIDECQFNGNLTVSDGTQYGGITGVKGVNFFIGGIVGHHQEGVVSNCTTQAGKAIDVRGTFNAYTGGIVGWIEQKETAAALDGCTNNMTVTFASNGARDVITPIALGGIVSYGQGASVSNCVNNGAVSTNCDANLLYAGGIAALGDNSTFSSCRNTAGVTHTNVTAATQTARYLAMGGIVGIFTENKGSESGTVSSCRNSGQILCNQLGTSTYTTVDMAGIVGKADVPVLITQSKNLKDGVVQVIDITGKTAFARTTMGGVVGYANKAGSVLRGCSNAAKIYCQYTKGGTSNRPTYMGGIAGFMGVANKSGCTGLAGLEIDDCHSSGCVQNQNYNNTLTLEGAPIHGGIVGAILGTETDKASIHDCTSSSPGTNPADSVITGQRGICGGIAGYVSHATLEGNASSATITINNNSQGCGGIVGWSVASFLSNCTYSGLIGAVSGTTGVAPKNVGGLIYKMDSGSIASCKVDGANISKGTHASATNPAVLVSEAAEGVTITNCGVKGTLDGSPITLSSNMITEDSGATVTGTYVIE